MRALVLVALLSMACPGSRTGDPGGADNAIVVIRCDVADASFWLDGRYIEEIGRIPRAGVSIKPGTHRLEIRHDDYFSHYAELELAPRERRTLDVDLAPVLP